MTQGKAETMCEHTDCEGKRYYGGLYNCPICEQQKRGRAYPILEIMVTNFINEYLQKAERLGIYPVEAYDIIYRRLE